MKPASASPSPLLVTVVVPVHNRPAPLRRLLSCLQAQTMPPERFSVLICDDGSIDDIAGVVAEMRSATGLSIEYQRQERSSAGAARNLGLRHAASELVAFTDSDCEPEPEWLVSLVAPFEDETVGMTGGPAEQGGDSLCGCAANFLMSSALGGAGVRDPRRCLGVRYLPRTFNCAVRLALARQVGGFPDWFYGEDISFSQALADTGAAIRFVPEAVVVHNERRSLVQLASSAFRKGLARLTLSRSAPRLEWVYFLPSLFLLYLTLLLPGLLFLALPLPVQAIASAPAFLYLLLLIVLAFEGTFSLRDPRALAIVPACAATMHLSYGAGLLGALIGLQRRPLDTRQAIQPRALRRSQDFDSQLEPPPKSLLRCQEVISKT